MELWIELDEIEKTVSLLDTGGTIFILGNVHQRWLTRPLVPFPSELKPEEKDYYRKHQFTAEPDEAADHLMITQGGREYSGPGGHLFIRKVIGMALGLTKQATHLSEHLATDVQAKHRQDYTVLAKRLKAFEVLLDNVLNVSDYQMLLDVLKEVNKNPEQKRFWYNGHRLIPDVFLYTSVHLEEIAQREIENTERLIKILENNKQPNTIIDLAKTSEEEYQRLLGPDLID